jgi:magnesium chelatase subunit D
LDSRSKVWVERGQASDVRPPAAEIESQNLQTNKPLSKANFRSYPFAAIVGHSTAKHALMLLAVDHHLRGLLLASANGNAKTTLSRAAQTLFQNRRAEKSPAPFIEVPLGLTLDRLLGGLDFEPTLLAGKKRFAQGVLAQAHGGVLMVDDINLLDDTLVTHIAAALDSRTLPIERDGLSLTAETDFVLLGVAQSSADKLSSLLRQRVGLIVESDSLNLIDERAEIVSRVIAYQAKPEDFIESYEAENRRILDTIEQARERLPFVNISPEDLRRLAAVSIHLEVEGNQADIFAARAAKANAALAGRELVNQADMITAIQLVLLPRARRIPLPDEATGQPSRQNDKPDDETLPQSPEPQTRQNPESPGAESADRTEGFRQDPADESEPQKINIGALEDLIISALDAQLPKDGLRPQIQNRQTPKSSTGKGADAPDHGRGRYVSHTAKKTPTKKIALAATLRAAAPYQNSRRAVTNVLRPSVKITADDLRYKRFRKKSAMLFIFAVDASGSMALNRMAQAKGAMTRLLQEAYIHRDKVSLISFRKDTAELLLPPTRSIELAKRVVEAMPTGGATPLAAALVKALEVAGRSRSAVISRTLLVMFTDGRANVGLQVEQSAEPIVRVEAIKSELRQLGVTLQLANINVLVMDTKAKFMAGGEARELAEIIGAQYCYLPRANDQMIYQSVSQLAKSLRQQ